MAKKINKRAKIIIAASVAAILLIGAIISIVLVLAATQQNISSNISISYVVDGVGAKVSAKYGVVPNSTDVTLASMTTSDGSTTELVFNTSDSQSQKALTPNGNINLTQETGTQVVFEYKFENIAETPFIVGLTTEETGLTKNIKETYYVSKTPLSGSEYGRIEYNTLAVQSLEYQDVLYIYVKVAVANLNLNAAYNKAYNWEINQVATEQVTVTLNNGSGTGGLTSATAYIGAATPILSAVPTAPSGNGFAGYFDGETQYISAQGVGLKEIESATTLTARYTESAVYDVMGTTMYGISPTASNTTITEVVIPAAITDIADGAFENQTTITAVNFEGTQSLSYASGSQLKRIGKNAFKGCTGLTELVIPSSVTEIEECALQNCTSLTKLTTPAVFEEGYTLSPCPGFAKIFTPATEDLDYVLEYDDNGNPIRFAEFYYSYNIPASLTHLVINGGKINYAAFVYLFIDTVEIYNVNSIADWAFYYSEIKNLVIGNSVTSIGENAFSDCSGLTSITIPNSVTSIGMYAFYYCSSLTSVTIGDSVTSIGEYAFGSCSSLTSVVIPNSVTSIGSDAFSGCTSLEYLEFPYVFSDSVDSYLFDYSIPLTLTEVVINGGTTIPDSAFSYISSLTSVTIGDSVTSIGQFAFHSCGLTSVTIGNSVTSIGNYAFTSCNSLTSVTIPNSVTSIGDSAFAYISSLTSVTIGDSVTSIGTYAFSSCGLTSVVIPNSVTSIGDNAFRYCSSLTSVTIGDSVKSIGIAAFSNCSSITSVTIPNSVTSIGSGAFSNCSNLTSVTFENTSGWKIYLSSTSTTGYEINVSTPATNATNLKNTNSTPSTPSTDATNWGKWTLKRS